MTASLVLLLLGGCTAAPSPALPPLQAGSPVALEPAEAVAAADLDGDGEDEVIRVREGVAYWLDQQAEVGGTVQVVDRGDVDGDGRQEAIIATGVGRRDRAAPVRVWAVRADGATLLWEHQGERNQVSDLHVEPGAEGQPDRVFVAYFSDGRNVTGGWLEGGELRAQTTASMGLRMMPLQDGSVLVGRLYGDEPKSPGDLSRVGADGARSPLASHRGVRALAQGDLDGDGRPEWLVADGWHYAYGEHADPDVRLFPGDGSGESRVIARLDGSYSAERIEVDTPPDGGAPVVLATASHGVYLLQRDALGWASTRIADAEETDNAVFLRQGSGLAVLLSGRPARTIPLTRGGR